jgi:glucosylceramidase
MKIDRRDFLVGSGLLLTAGAVSDNAQRKELGGRITADVNKADRKTSVYTTAKDTEYRLSPTGTLEFKQHGQPLETQTCVFVDPSKQFEIFIGIGGALTDASAETYAKLPPAKQQELIDAYFDPAKGIGYTLARTNIHSCDFSSDSYTYVKEGDTALTSFNVGHDRRYRIPFIKRAIAATGNNLKIFGSPWSPPAFMKSNNDMLHGGKLKREFYQPWANYFAKFIKAYAAEGVPIWGVTIQNEPMATQKWESCIFTAEDERDFLRDHLGPTLHREGLANKNIIIWDHNRDLIYQRVSTLLKDPAAAKYAWGIGYHWYEPWSGGEMMFDNVKLVHETFPDKHLMFTEGCVDVFNAGRLHAWSLGERYGSSMIRDLNNGTVGWTDWNVLLDEKGGPNHVQNYCFAPVHADTRTGEITYTNSYHYIGHFSKFIRPGARRIAAAPSRSSLLSTAFTNTDGTNVAVVMNPGEKPVNYFLWTNGSAAEVTSPPRSIQTLVF